MTTVSLFKWSKPTNKSFFEKGHETLRRQKSHSEGAEGKKPVQGNQGHRDSPAHLRPLQGHHRAPAQEPVVRQLQGHGRQVSGRRQDRENAQDHSRLPRECVVQVRVFQLLIFKK